jgi:aspartate aminotransferase
MLSSPRPCQPRIRPPGLHGLGHRLLVISATVTSERVPWSWTIRFRRRHSEIAPSLRASSPLDPFTEDRLSHQVRGIQSSVTLDVSATAAALRAQGKQVIAFGAGEPDLPVPPLVQEAAHRAVQEGKGRYTPASGLPALREAVAAKFTADGFSLGPDQVIVTAGAKSGLFLALYALLDAGDECIFPAPYWSSYPEIVRGAGGIPKVFPTSASEDFQPHPDVLRAAITDRTKVILLNSPNNPSGTVYARSSLEALADVIRERDLFVISDDIYEHLIYTDEPFVNLLHVAPDLSERVLLVNSLSKSHSMTGWRLGFCGGPKALIAAMGRAQSQMVGNPNAISQYAAMAALGSPIDPERRQNLDRRRHLMLSGIRQLPHVTCPEPRGAFYAFPSIEHYLGRRFAGIPIPDATAFARLFLQERLVATVTGDAFGAPGHIRLTYCTSETEIVEGLGRLASFLDALN